ncbi:MAG: TRAP transporter large permease [Betaproteobacteria bacterium]|jgi:tripartite ATP-independent transporter DctM subunit|nr:TRAP transporter large permease [Betaproteobacteria bacterium]
MVEALLGFAAMFVLTLLRIPIAVSMGVVGFVGLGLLRSWNASIASATAVIYETGFSYALSVVPLFILMGNFVTRAGMSQELYRAAYTFFGNWRGGLAMSTVVACGGFSAICGSSLATAATMSKVAMPSMRKFHYSEGLAAGSIAAGGTLGIMIPPSVIMVIYGLMTETNIGSLFAAGILPGILAVSCYMGAVGWTTWRDPKAGPPGERSSWAERLRALRDIWGVVALFVLVLGGIYGGVFTPTEAAGVGAAGGFLFALGRRALTWKTLFAVLIESARTTAMLFVILIGALIFANFINFTTMPADLRTFVGQFELHPVFVVVAMCVVYIILGCMLESLSMILLTVPLFFPLVSHLGLDPVWFGIVVVTVVEISLITPPVGLNVFVLRTLLPEIPLGTMFRGVGPFIVADFVRLTLLISFPIISLWLPRLFF